VPVHESFGWGGGAAHCLGAKRADVIRLGTAPVESYALAFYGVDRGFSKPSTSTCRSSRSAAARGHDGGSGGALDIGCANVGAQANAYMRNLPFAMIAAAATTRAPHRRRSSRLRRTHRSKPARTQRQDDRLLDAQRSAASLGDEVGGCNVAIRRHSSFSRSRCPRWHRRWSPAGSTAPANSSHRSRSPRTTSASLEVLRRDLEDADDYDPLRQQRLARQESGRRQGFHRAMRATRNGPTKTGGRCSDLERISQIPASTVGVMNRVLFGESLDARRFSR